ncbi:hypothetical protein PInf_022829 [Phytophthora infestans]|nr:hypothetical protein PInf_022829 [Phytophthora infestans]
MEVSSSSSSDADNLLDDAELQVSSGSMMMTETVLDDVPNAQNTDDIAGPIRDVGDDKADNNSKENSDTADSGDLQSSDNDDSSEPDQEEKEGSETTSSTSRLDPSVLCPQRVLVSRQPN